MTVRTHFRVRVVPVIIACLCAACGSDVDWIDAPPEELHGLWIEQSEDIDAGIEFADTLRLSSDTLILSDPTTDGHLNRRVCTPIRRVSRTDDGYVVFCGRPNDDFIAETRFEIDPNEAFDEAVVGEIVATGVNQNDGYFSLGRFTKRQ